MRHGERGDDDHERPEPARRQDQAEKEQQVIETLEDVVEAEPHEAPRRLMPARIERHRAGIADELEGALGMARARGTAAR